MTASVIADPSTAPTWIEAEPLNDVVSENEPASRTFCLFSRPSKRPLRSTISSLMNVLLARIEGVLLLFEYQKHHDRFQLLKLRKEI